MTAPRQVLPGTTYLVTRRCTQRQFLLRPSAELGAIFVYVLALAARRYGVQVHAFCVLSNHVHLVVTDPDARLPAFAQYLGALVARAANVLLRRSESFWAPGSFSAVALAAREDVVAKAAYVLANPVTAGLVHRAREWPGPWTAPEQLGRAALTATRPDGFFRKKGSLPDNVELQLTTPPAVGHIDAFRVDVAEELDALERTAHRERGATGDEPGAPGGFLGAARVLAQDPRDHPRTWEPRGTLNPRVAARDKWKRIEVLKRLVQFLKAYRAAWRARLAGDDAALFPAGTYLLRVAHRVRCAAPA
jgi:REP element-mobilizing transposase RayT